MRRRKLRAINKDLRLLHQGKRQHNSQVMLPYTNMGRRILGERSIMPMAGKNSELKFVESWFCGIN